MSNSTTSTLSKWLSRLQTIALVVLIFFAIAPIIFAAIPGDTSNNAFSIYNTGYDGLSEFREQIEVIDKVDGSDKYNVSNIVSNLNALNRFNGSGILMIIGPSSNFEYSETISMLLFLLRGGSVVIADDYGTGNQILDPIFDLLENWDSTAEYAQENLDLELPTISGILGDLIGGGNGTTSTPTDPSEFLSPEFLVQMIGNKLKRFGFNSSGILMDAENNDGHPARVIVEDIDKQPSQFTITDNVDRIAMEFGSHINLKLNYTRTLPDGSTAVDEDGDPIYVQRFEPLQKLSVSLINEEFGDGTLELSAPIFPLYSSQSSWIETDFEGAASGDFEPDIEEWGNVKFAIELTLPLPKNALMLISDPSIFINRYTQQPSTFDNIRLATNIIEMLGGLSDPKPGPIPVIFDFGHVYQGFTSPALYSTALLKILSEISMFPLYAPFVPFFAFGYGRRLMPESRRLRPILLTKRRGEKGHSDFEKKLELIKQTGTYGEPIMHLVRRLVRNVRKDVRFEGVTPKNPRDMARFFRDNFPQSVSSERELRSQFSQLFKIADHPTRRMSKVAAKRYLTLLKRLNELVEQSQ